MHRPLPRPGITVLALLACVAACLPGWALADAAAAPGTAPPTTQSATAGTTAAQLDAYLAGNGSPMAGQGASLMASGGRWQIDPRLIVAIAGAESNFGAITCAPYNAWGYGCPNGPYVFSSWADGIDAVAQGLRSNYLSEGRVSVALINLKYAPLGAANDPTGLNNNWTANVSRFLTELGGDPNDIDTGGIGGTRLIGVPPPLASAPTLDAFQFDESAATGSTGDAAADTPATPAGTVTPDLVVSAGAPAPLVVTVKNTGLATWRADNVRLRRVDLEPRVVGAPYGALSDSGEVAPGEEARFVVALAAAGRSDGEASTVWRLEGPAGAFGAEITRTVRFAVPAFVAADARVDVTAANTGIAGGEPAWNVVVHVRNAGSATWRRAGDAGVMIAVRRSIGGSMAREGWLSETVAAHMLERTAAPGEEASFAFRVRGTDRAAAFGVVSAGTFAAGRPIVVGVGAVDPSVLSGLAADAPVT